MGVQKGVLLSGDNGFYDEVGDVIGIDSEWVRLRHLAFGVEGNDGKAPCLQEQVAAGLRLYVVTAKLLANVLEPADAPLVEQTTKLIQAVLKCE